MIHSIRHMIGSSDCTTQTKDGDWATAVPLPFYEGLLGRIRDAWSVLTGKSFAVQWPQGGELEQALQLRREPRNSPIKPQPPKSHTVHNGIAKDLL